MKTWDVIIIGAGAIGMSLAWRLRQRGLAVLVVEKGEPGREATHAAGGMIAHCDPNLPPLLRPLARASAALYPEFVRELRAEAFESPDLRENGTIGFFAEDESPLCEDARALDDDELARLEPLLTLRGRAYWLPEYSLDPRKLGSALERAARTLGVDFVTGSPVRELAVLGGRAAGVRTSKSFYAAGTVVNCAGAWACDVQPLGMPTHPVKGQMVCVVPAAHHSGAPVQHVVRTPEVYIIPRSDGRVLLGATVEDAGYDKRVDGETVQRLHHAAARAVPEIAHMRIHDVWAGLRPGTPDALPLLGPTRLPGYFAATGHYRDGILLAPITAQIMAEAITGQAPEFDLAAFSPLRFS